MFDPEKYSKLLVPKSTHATIRNYAFENGIKVWKAADELLQIGLKEKQKH